MKAKNKVRRYYNLMSSFSNWPQYLRFKAFGQQEAFDFRLKNGFSVRVPRQMLSPFRECFFDQIYFKCLPNEVANFTNPTIIDIGANVGFYALFMFYQYPQATIYSFEPMPFNFRVLSQYQKTYSSFAWHVDERAVSESDEAIALHTSSTESFTTMASVFDKGSNRQRIEVAATSLSQIVETYGIEHIDMLKLDCEGAEYAILYTLPKELLQSVRVLMIETHQGTQPEENTEALVSYLRKQGFSLHYLLKENTGYIWAWQERH